MAPIVLYSVRSLGLSVLVALFFSLSGAHAATVLLDSDGDGILDAWETMVYRTDPLQADTDGDRYDDRTELINGYHPLRGGRLTDTDYDQDGLNDRLELLFGTDPTVFDSNSNGSSDGTDILAGMSPTSTVPMPLQKSLFISLKRQTLERRVSNVPIDSFLVSTGLPRTPTPVGTFKVLQKNPRAWSNSAKLWMPYWMHFSGRGHGLHELPEWPNGRKEGENHLGKLASHGCIRMGIGTAKMVYDWSPVGTPVVISKL